MDLRGRKVRRDRKASQDLKVLLGRRVSPVRSARQGLKALLGPRGRKAHLGRQDLPALVATRSSIPSEPCLRMAPLNLLRPARQASGCWGVVMPSRVPLIAHRCLDRMATTLGE